MLGTPTRDKFNLVPRSRDPSGLPQKSRPLGLTEKSRWLLKLVHFNHNLRRTRRNFRFRFWIRPEPLRFPTAGQGDAGSGDEIGDKLGHTEHAQNREGQILAQCGGNAWETKDCSGERGTFLSGQLFAIYRQVLT